MRMLKKIKNNSRGASFVFALVMFLIISIICVTIVNAAVLNVSRSSSEIDEEKAYLATTSAAKILRDSLGDATYMIEVSDAAGATNEGEITGMEKAPNIKEIILDMTDSLVKGTTQNAVDVTIDAGTDIPKVEGKLKMDSGYSMTVTLSVDEDEEIEGDYPLTLHFQGAWSTDTEIITNDDATTTTIETTRISWPKDGVYITNGR